MTPPLLQAYNFNVMFFLLYDSPYDNFFIGKAKLFL